MAEKEKSVSEATAKQEKSKKAKADKPKKEKGRVAKAWRGFKSELKKIVWPSWSQVWKNSILVIVVVAICAAAIFLLDFTLHEGFNALIELVQGWFKK